MLGFRFLVVLHHSMDDVPLRLFDSEEDALEYTKTCDWQPPALVAKSLTLPDMDTPNVISIVKFFDGIPCGREIVRDYEEETGELEDALNGE